MDFTLNYRKPYHGRCLDGPFEGETIEHDAPYFSGYYRRPIGLFTTGISAAIEIDRVIYKWLPSYRAWAWWQLS